jgi:beta-N-acetylhexosaminidase
MNHHNLHTKSNSTRPYFKNPLVVSACVLALAYIFLSGNSYQTVGDYKLNSSRIVFNKQIPEISTISLELIPEEQAGFINRLFFSQYYEMVAAQKQRQQLAQQDNIFTNQLKQGFPEQTGLSSQKLSVIDSIMLDAINRGAMPGGQVFIAKNGIIVYEKAFGYHDYTQTHPVELTDLYDVASVTKIAATTLAAMKLTQEKKLDLDAPLGKYFTDTLIRYKYLKKDTVINALTYNVSGKTNNQIRKLIGKRNYNFINDSVVTVYETILKPIMPESNIFRVPVYRLLTHQSGINPSLPLMPYLMYAETYQKIIGKNQNEYQMASLNRENYSDIYDHQTDDLIMPDVKEIDQVHEDARPFDFSIEEAFSYFFSKTNNNGLASTSITENMYLKNQFKDSLYQAIKRIHVCNKQELQYADINMILLQMVMDSINQTNLDTYTKKEFYEKLGMKHTTFNPLNHFPKENIVPTEEEKYWRGQLIHGTVHDPSAALMGGIAGNAGLFSTASDLGILGQMLLNGGTYGDEQFLDKEIIETFTENNPDTNRGLGFNKATQGGGYAFTAPESTYGHTGFTGTAMWVDPENEIVYVFLSNRVLPNASNNMLLDLRIREKVHQAVYNAMTP